MKSNLNFAHATATSAQHPRARWQTPALSLRKGTQHGSTTIALGPEVRLPVLPRNRAYLKALREAELAAWETAKPLTDLKPKAQPAPARLPSAEREVGENRVYALLAAAAVLALGYQLRSLLLSAGGWRDFVEFVQRFLT